MSLTEVEEWRGVGLRHNLVSVPAGVGLVGGKVEGGQNATASVDHGPVYF